MGIQLEFDNDTLKNQVAIFTQLEAEVNAARQAVNTAVTEEQRKAAEEQLAAIEAASDEIRRLI
jgi:hypothetical protein